VTDFDLDEYTRLGNLLVRSGCITDKQLARVRSAQRNGSSGKRLGDLVVEFDFCSKDDVDSALKEQERDRVPQRSKSDAGFKALHIAMDSLNLEADRLTKRDDGEQSGPITIDL